MSNHFDGFPDVVEAQQFSKEWMEDVLFPTTDGMIKLSKRAEYKPLIGKEMISLFVGESLRTRARFTIAMQRLGGQLTFDTEAARSFSSMAKGESLEDTIIVLNEYEADVIEK